MRGPAESESHIDATAHGHRGTTVCNTQTYNGLSAFSLLGNRGRLGILSYNLKRTINREGVPALLAALA